MEELNKYIVGQDKAKRAVAIAMRNRIRRQKLPEEIRRRNTKEHFDDGAYWSWEDGDR